jgi:hypothetical protein
MLLKAYQQEIKDKVLFTELRNLSDLSDLDPILARNGFVYKKHLNYLIDIDRPVGGILQGVSSRTRKKIRKGLRDNLVQVTEVIDRRKLDHWYEILKKSFKHAQIPLADHSLFEAAFDVLYPKGMAKFLLAKIKGATAACALELLYYVSILKFDSN